MNQVSPLQFRRFVIAASAVVFTALAACTTVMPKLQIANFQATAADLEGRWTGTYICSQGPTGVRLSLRATSEKTATGTFEFFPVSANSKEPSGSFSVTGVISRPGQLEMTPGAWIVRPNGYMMLRVSAAIFNDPDKLAGSVTEASCGRFEVQRNAAAAPAPAPASASASASASPVTPSQSVSATHETGPQSSGRSATVSSYPLTHAQFVTLIGREKLPKLVGTTLALNLKRGGDGGWTGYVEDPRSMVFFSCSTAAKAFVGGAIVSKVKAIRSNDNGVFVVLDRCGPAGSV